MQPNKKITWAVRPTIDADAARELAGFSPELSQLLFNRGICTAAEAGEYIAYAPPEGCNPFDILGMQEAVERVMQAVRLEEPVAVYGDYDCDGVTATAVLVQALQRMGALVVPYIPNRFDEGYGLNLPALEELHRKGIRLVITVDCGVRSIPEAAFAREIGLDMIITDHHSCGDELPAAAAVINPRQPGDDYQHKNLTGVGLAYKLVQALYADDPYLTEQVDEWLDLVALGTIADMAPLSEENRYLVAKGIRKIREGWRLGLRSLIGSTRTSSENVTSHDIGFLIAPRLNAAGRLDTALDAYHLLTTTKPEEASVLAQRLDDQNKERQKITAEMQAHAEAEILNRDEGCFLAYAASETYNAGVVGLAASRVLETFYRPAIIAKINGETTRASCRSIPSFNITEALDRCEDLLVMHGGHSAAAGFTVRNENRDELIRRLEAIAAEQFQDPDSLVRKFTADMRLSPSLLDFDLIRDISKLQPTGMGNPEPLFLSENVQVRKKWAMKDGQHLKLVLADRTQIGQVAVGWRMGSRLETLPERVDVLWSAAVDDFRGTLGLQMVLKDIRPAQGI